MKRINIRNERKTRGLLLCALQRFAEIISDGGTWGRSFCRRGAKWQMWQRLKRVRKLDEVREGEGFGGRRRRVPEKLQNSKSAGTSRRKEPVGLLGCEG